MNMQNIFEKAKEKQNKKTERLKTYYKSERNNWVEAKDARKEAFDFLKTRQGDNNEAVKARNRQIMMKLKRS